MKSEQMTAAAAEDFHRLIGIKRTTFDVMAKILHAAGTLLKAHGGKPSKLDLPSL